MGENALSSFCSLDILRHHDAHCLDFEREWQAGKRPKLEDYLAREPEGRPALVRELLLVELEYRRRAGETPAVDDYVPRLPRHREIVEHVLRDVRGEEAVDGRFCILDRIATGGVGQVLSAYDLKLRREVALKELLDRNAGETELRRRFVRECRITSRLEHPGIVPIYDLGRRSDGRPFYAMRLIRGQSLQTAIKEAHGEGPPAPRMLRELLRRLIDVGRAMDYAHHQGVVHRDLKPANIMLGPYGETLVVDWGLAKIVDDLAEVQAESRLAVGVTATQLGTVIGTPAYMSPEQAAGDVDQVGPQSDVYGLGATLYAVLTGARPFDGPPEEVLSKVRGRGLRKPSRVATGVPRPLEAICLKAMARPPEERYPSAGAWADDILCWLDDEPVSVYRDSFAVRCARWARKNRSVATGVVTLSLAGMVALAVGTVIFEERELALEERAVAQSNFERAHRTVGDLLSDISDQPSLQIPGFWPLRQKLLGRGFDYYQAGLEQHAGGPLDRAVLTESYYRAGKIASELGERDDAIASLERAIELQRELLVATPGDPRYRADLARSYDDLAIMQLLDNRLDEVGASLESALDLRQQLARDFPDDAEIKNGLATTLSQSAYLEWYSDARRASEIYEQARRLREEVVEEHPERSEFRDGLAKIYNNLGLLRRELGDADGAVEMHERTRRLQQELLDESPDDMQAKSVLAKTLANLGVAQVAADRVADAGRSYAEASRLFDELAVANPAVPGFQIDRAKMIANEAEQARRLGDAGKAVDFLHQALEIHREVLAVDVNLLPARVSLGHTYHALAQAYEGQGQLERALAAAGQAKDNHQALAAGDPSNLYVGSDLAQMLHRRAGLLWRLGHHREAVREYRSAIERQQELAGSSPPESAAQAYLSQWLTELRDRLSQLPESPRNELLRSLGELAELPALATLR